MDTLRARLADAGLGAHADRLVGFARPGYALRLAGPASGRVGESRVGGLPDLPVGTPWPGAEDDAPYPFLCQLNLADVPPVEGAPLPADGMLYLFLGTDEPATNVEVALWHAPPGTPLAPAARPEGADDAFGDYDGLAPHALAFAPLADLPRWATDLRDAVVEPLAEAEQDAYDTVAEALDEGAAGMLLGHVASVQHDPREDAVVVREFNPAWLYDFDRRGRLPLAERAERWHALLRLGSIRAARLNFWDAGWLNVLLPDDALAAFDLARHYAAIETS